MGTTTEELKKLYAKLGGTEETAKDTSTPGEVLNAINELDIGGGSGNLPPVTPEDNGKVLGVVNGNWAKTEVEAQIADESVTTAKLHDEAITTDKMSDYAVTTDKVANEAITAEKIKIASRTRSKNAGEDGLSLSVTTENGQITAVSHRILMIIMAQQTQPKVKSLEHLKMIRMQTQSTVQRHILMKQLQMLLSLIGIRPTTHSRTTSKISLS